MTFANTTQDPTKPYVRPENTVSGPFRSRGLIQPIQPAPHQKTRLTRSLSMPLTPRSYQSGGITDDLPVLQPHPLLNPGTLAFFDFSVMKDDFTQVPDNILADWWQWSLSRDGKVFPQMTDIAVNWHTAPPNQNKAWYDGLAVPTFEIQQYFLNNATPADDNATSILAFKVNNLATRANAILAFGLTVNQAVSGSKVAVYLSGTIAGTPDWTGDLWQSSLHLTSLDPSDNMHGEPLQYVSRPLTPADNPIIVFTPGPMTSVSGASNSTLVFDICLTPIFPAQAYSTTARLGGFANSNSNGVPGVAAGNPNVAAFAHPLAYRAEGVTTPSYGPIMPMSTGYAIGQNLLAPGLAMKSGDNIMGYPKNWTQSPRLYYGPDGYPDTWNPVTCQYVAGLTNPGSVYYSYNTQPVPGTVLAFTTAGGAGTVNVWLNGNSSTTPDFTDTQAGGSYSKPYVSRALTAADRPLIILSNTTSLSLVPTEVSTSQLQALVGQKPSIQFRSVLSQLTGLVSSPVAGGLHNLSNPPSVYMGLTIYQNANDMGTLMNGSYMHFGAADYSGNGVTSVAKGHAFFAFGLVNGVPTCWVGNKTLTYNAGNGSLVASVLTYGLLFQKWTMVGGAMYYRVRFYLNGQLQDQMYMSPAEIAQYMSFTSLAAQYEGIASLPSYGTQLNYIPLRFYADLTDNYWNGEEMAIMDASTAQRLGTPPAAIPGNIAM